jgi:hypothetical protein
MVGACDETWALKVIRTCGLDDSVIAKVVEEPRHRKAVTQLIELIRLGRGERPLIQVSGELASA